MDENGYNWPSKKVWKMVESQRKVREKSGNFEMDIEWQPCIKASYQTHYIRVPLLG